MCEREVLSFPRPTWHCRIMSTLGTYRERLGWPESGQHDEYRVRTGYWEKVGSKLGL